MFSPKVIVSLRKIGGLHRRTSFRGLHSAERLRDILDRERARADRTGDQFSLLAFAAAERTTTPGTLARLVKVLERRLRFTDEIGWLDDRQIGVVLHATSARGAWKVADDVCLEFPPGSSKPVCRVYTYPSQQPLPEHAEADSDRYLPRHEKPAYAMETLFIQQTPAAKRCMDAFGAAIGMVLLLPLLVVVAVAIKITSPGPILFRQQREGRGGKCFTMYKFRSMVVDAEARKRELLVLNEQDGPAFKIGNDPRVTALGRFLRSTSIDELPQLWNVLKGEMSLVGPRPLPCEESEACMGWYRRRLEVTPGLTCIWQVKGRSRVSFADWVRMDVRYIHSRSLMYDLKLLAQTVFVVLRKGGY